MIKKLQKKFIAIAMLAIIVVTGSIFGVIIIENYTRTNRQIDGILNLISENDGKIPEYKPRNDELKEIITKETQFSTRYFIIRINHNGEIIETNMQHIAAVSQGEAKQILEDINKDDKDKGFYENYKYQITQNENGYLIVFLDCTNQLNNLEMLINQSLIIIGVGLIIVFIFVSFLSKKALNPIIENMEKQKQFITNAGHELKTPVAVILANVDVMELTSSKENIEWLKSIKNQALRLDSLIKSLLELSNIEEKQLRSNYSIFEINKLIKDEINEFKAIAKEKHISFEAKEDILINADINSIKEVITILLDNALKYTPENGNIKIKTEKQGKNLKIQCLNTIENSKNINIRKLFDRFYRADKSRSKDKEGYGIGLSIAKSIVESHKGKIYAEINKDDMICFTIIFPGIE